VKVTVKSTAPTAPEGTWNSQPPSVVQFSPELSDMDRRLKQHSYDQLQLLLKTHRFPRAIALVEGLAQRLPEDIEVRQWQAIAYQRWGRQLIQDRQYDKARVYLKKALKTDPHNRALWSEVEREFQRLEKVY
jgi:tetratricopeptide (TPR) repeat protein